MTWVKIATTSFSGASSVNVDNVFSATYTHYLVVRNLLGSTADNRISVRLRVGGADASGTNYRKQIAYADATTIVGARSTGETSFTDLLGSTEVTAFGYSAVRISNPFEAVRTTAWSDYGYDNDGGIYLFRSVFAHDLTTSYTGFTAIPNSGTITGSLTVYGLKAS